MLENSYIVTEQKRQAKNIVLTKRFHWPYVGGWLLFNIAQTLLLEFFVLFSLTRLKHVRLPWPTEYYLLLTAIFTVLFIGVLSFIGISWAHRIAGVYIRIERVFRKIADGDFTQRLKFRASDQLDQLELAFHAMMVSFESPLPADSDASETLSDDDDSDENERRNWKNMQLTSRYHFSYMAVWVLLSIGLLILVYAAGFFALHIGRFGQPQSFLANLDALPVIASALGLTVGFLILWQGMKTAHKLAGVHIRLERTFQRVASGERDLQLKFRASDKLASLEEAFADMMKTLNSRSTDPSH